MDDVGNALSQAYRKMMAEKTEAAAVAYREALAAARNHAGFLPYGLPRDLAGARSTALMAHDVPDPESLRAGTRAARADGLTPEALERAIAEGERRIRKFCELSVLTAGDPKFNSGRNLRLPYTPLIPSDVWDRWSADLRAAGYDVMFLPPPPRAPKFMRVAAPPV